MKRHPRMEAFSLVEAVLALGIAAVGFIAIAGILPIGVRETASARFETDASHLARAVVAELQLLTEEDNAFYGKALSLRTLSASDRIEYYASFREGGDPLLSAASSRERPVQVELRFEGVVSEGERIANQVFVKVKLPGVGEYEAGTILGIY